MKLIEFSHGQAQPIERFASVAAASLPLGDGRGETHVHCVFFDAGGRSGEHPTGFAQLFLVIEGSGWTTGADGLRVELRAGQGVYFERGENHSKGSEAGMTAIIIQVAELMPLRLRGEPRWERIGPPKKSLNNTSGIWGRNSGLSTTL